MNLREIAWIVWGLSSLVFMEPYAAQQIEEHSRQEVMSKLLNKEYDPRIAPHFDEDFATNVTILLIIQDMHSVSETAMEYSVDIFLRMWWVDERLDYSNLSSQPKLELDTKNIGSVWQPDVYFKNEKRASVHSVTTQNKLMHIHRNGTVVYSTRIAMTLGCTMSLLYYPFDRQRCPLIIQSYGYTRDNIDLLWDSRKPIKIASEFEMPQFDLNEKFRTSRFDVDVSSTGVFATLKVELDLSRNVGFYFLQVFVPSVLLVLLSWISFWVDPNAVPARVSLGVTCVLTMTTQSSGIRQSLPPVSYVKAIDVWMCVCLMFVFAALLEFAYVNVLMRKAKDAKESKEKDKALSDEMDKKPGDLEIEHIPDRKRKHHAKAWFARVKDLLHPPVDSQRSEAKRVDCISRIVFPTVFFLFLFIFFIVCFSSRTHSLDK